MASLVQISQPRLLTDATANTQFLGGEQVNLGLELNVFQDGTTDGWIAPKPAARVPQSWGVYGPEP